MPRIDIGQEMLLSINSVFLLHSGFEHTLGNFFVKVPLHQTACDLESTICKYQATKSLFDHETTYITVVFTIYVVSLPVHVAEAGSFHEVFTILQKTVALYR